MHWEEVSFNSTNVNVDGATLVEGVCFGAFDVNPETALRICLHIADCKVKIEVKKSSSTCSKPEKLDSIRPRAWNVRERATKITRNRSLVIGWRFG